MDKEILLKHWEAEAQKPFSGWDFSYLRGRYREEKPSWSYDALAREALRNTDTVLDMGTGGGEKLLQFRDALPEITIATEGYAPNVLVAHASLASHNIPVVPYDSETDARMPFADASFGLVINRHDSFAVTELARILRPGGVFLTQQVDGRNLADLQALFGMTIAYQHVTLSHYQQAFVATGFEIERIEDWQGVTEFSDVGALVYYLHAIPWEVPEDFSVRRYQDVLLSLHQREIPLQFTSRRFLLQGRKPV
ncbi:MAG: class I SAM-dependent methyltransferase [Aggregatilineales bacterium]